ncbi:MAG: glutamyl-tRNA reductase [Acidobacteria bacterium]|nr:MAG: glutamyl-tRNA reductase [Acidobacteriota bacterium]
MEIVLIGLNHRTAPVELRERVSFTQEAAKLASEQLRSQGVLSETLVLSTCNRSELYGVPPESAASAKESAGAMELFLATFHQIEPAVLNDSLYRHYDREAVRHLFRVAAGLDSMMLGEAEILGQIREAYRIAVDHGGTGPVLNRMFQSALEVGKRVRAETQISTRPMSVAFAGVKLAERIFGSLRSHSALILGAGSTGEQVVAHLRDRGISRLGVANRSRQRAVELAERFGADVVDWEALDSALIWPDTVVCSVASSEPVVSRAAVRRAMAARSNRSLLFVDLGVPRNVSPGVADLYNVYLYGVDDLKEIVEQNKRAREAEIPKVEVLVEEHVTKFESWQAGVEAGAVLRELRSRLGAEREAFLRERLSDMPHLSPDDKRRIAALMDELLERVLLEPAAQLKTVPDLRRKVQNLEALRDLFRLDQGKP